MDIVTRLKSFISHLQIPVTQFADNARIPRPTLSQLLNGRNKKVSDEVISKIHVAFPQLNVLWLLFGEGDMTVNNSILSAPKSDKPSPVETPNQLSFNNINPGIDFSNGFRESVAKKFEMQSLHKSSPISQNSDTHPPRTLSPVADDSSDEEEQPGSPASASISFPLSQDRKIVNIIVYYSDNSFESFVPENLCSSNTSVQ